MEWIRIMVITLIYIHEPKTVTWAKECEIPDYAYSEKRRKNQHNDEMVYASKENDQENKNTLYNSKLMSINTKKKIDSTFEGEDPRIYKREPFHNQNYLDRCYFKNRILLPLLNKSTYYTLMDRYRPYGYSEYDNIPKNVLNIYKINNQESVDPRDMIKLPRLQEQCDMNLRYSSGPEECLIAKDLQQPNELHTSEDMPKEQYADTDESSDNSDENINPAIMPAKINLQNFRIDDQGLKNKTIIDTIQNKFKDVLHEIKTDGRGNTSSNSNFRNLNKKVTMTPTPRSVKSNSDQTIEGLLEEATTRNYTYNLKTTVLHSPFKDIPISADKNFSIINRATTKLENLLTVKINTTLTYKGEVTTSETQVSASSVQSGQQSKNNMTDQHLTYTLTDANCSLIKNELGKLATASPNKKNPIANTEQQKKLLKSNKKSHIDEIDSDKNFYQSKKFNWFQELPTSNQQDNQRKKSGQVPLEPKLRNPTSDSNNVNNSNPNFHQTVDTNNKKTKYTAAKTGMFNKWRKQQSINWPLNSLKYHLNRVVPDDTPQYLQHDTEAPPTNLNHPNVEKKQFNSCQYKYSGQHPLPDEEEVVHLADDGYIKNGAKCNVNNQLLINNNFNHGEYDDKLMGSYILPQNEINENEQDERWRKSATMSQGVVEVKSTGRKLKRKRREDKESIGTHNIEKQRSKIGKVTSQKNYELSNTEGSLLEKNKTNQPLQNDNRNFAISKSKNKCVLGDIQFERNGDSIGEPDVILDTEKTLVEKQIYTTTKMETSSIKMDVPKKHKSGSNILSNDVLTTQLKEFKELYRKLQIFQRNKKDFVDNVVTLLQQADKCPTSETLQPASAENSQRLKTISNNKLTTGVLKCMGMSNNLSWLPLIVIETPRKTEEIKMEKYDRINGSERNGTGGNMTIILQQLKNSAENLKRDIHCCFKLNKPNCNENNAEKEKLKQIDLKIQSKKTNGCPLKETSIEMVLTKDRVNKSEESLNQATDTTNEDIEPSQSEINNCTTNNSIEIPHQCTREFNLSARDEQKSNEAPLNKWEDSCPSQNLTDKENKFHNGNCSITDVNNTDISPKMFMWMQNQIRQVNNSRSKGTDKSTGIMQFVQQNRGNPGEKENYLARKDGKPDKEFNSRILNRQRASKLQFVDCLNKFRRDYLKNNEREAAGHVKAEQSPQGKACYIEGIRIDKETPHEIFNGNTKFNSRPNQEAETWSLDTIKLHEPNQPKGENEIATKIMKKCENLRNNISSILNMLSRELQQKNLEKHYHSANLPMGRCFINKLNASNGNSTDNLVNIKEGKGKVFNTKDLNGEKEIIKDLNATDIRAKTIDCPNGKSVNSGGKDWAIEASNKTFVQSINKDETLKKMSDEKLAHLTDMEKASKIEDTTQKGSTKFFSKNKTGQIKYLCQDKELLNLRDIINNDEIYANRIDSLLKSTQDYSHLEQTHKVDNDSSRVTIDNDALRQLYRKTEPKAGDGSLLNEPSVEVAHNKHIFHPVTSRVMTLGKGNSAKTNNNLDQILFVTEESKKFMGGKNDSAVILKKYTPMKYNRNSMDLSDMSKFSKIVNSIQSIPCRVAMDILGTVFMDNNSTNIPNSMNYLLQKKWKREAAPTSNNTDLDLKFKKSKRKNKLKKYKNYRNKCNAQKECPGKNDDVFIKTANKNCQVKKKKIKQIYMPNMQGRKGLQIGPPLFFADNIITISVTPCDDSAKSPNSRVRISPVMLKNCMDRPDNKSRDIAMLNEAKYFVMTNAKDTTDRLKVQESQGKPPCFECGDKEKSGVANMKMENGTKKSRLSDSDTDNISTTEDMLKDKETKYYTMEEETRSTKYYSDQPSQRKTPRTTHTPGKQLKTRTQPTTNENEYENDNDSTNLKQSKEPYSQNNRENMTSDKQSMENEEFTITLKPSRHQFSKAHATTPIMPTMESMENQKKSPGNGKINIQNMDIDYDADYYVTDSYSHRYSRPHPTYSTAASSSETVTNYQFKQPYNNKDKIQQEELTPKTYPGDSYRFTKQSRLEQTTCNCHNADSNEYMTQNNYVQVHGTTQSRFQTISFDYYQDTDSKNDIHRSRPFGSTNETDEPKEVEVTHFQQYDIYQSNETEKNDQAEKENEKIWSNHTTTEIQYDGELDSSMESDKSPAQLLDQIKTLSSTPYVFDRSTQDIPDKNAMEEWQTHFDKKETALTTDHYMVTTNEQTEPSYKNKEDGREWFVQGQKSEAQNKDGEQDGPPVQSPILSTEAQQGPVDEPLNEAEDSKDNEDEDEDSQEDVEKQTDTYMFRQDAGLTTQSQSHGQTSEEEIDDDEDEDEDEDSTDFQEILFWQKVTQNPSIPLTPRQKLFPVEPDENLEVSAQNGTQEQSVEIDIKAMKTELERLKELLKDGPMVDKINAFLTVEPDTEITTSKSKLEKLFFNKYDKSLLNNNHSGIEDMIGKKNSSNNRHFISFDNFVTLVNDQMEELAVPRILLKTDNNSTSLHKTNRDKGVPIENPPFHMTNHTNSNEIMNFSNIVAQNRSHNGKKSDWDNSSIMIQMDNSSGIRELEAVENDKLRRIPMPHFRKPVNGNKDPSHTYREIAPSSDLANNNKKVKSIDIESVDAGRSTQNDTPANGVDYMFDSNNEAKLSKKINTTEIALGNNSYSENRSDVIILDNASSDPADWILHDNNIWNMIPCGNIKRLNSNYDIEEQSKGVIHKDRIKIAADDPKLFKRREEFGSHNTDCDCNQNPLVKLNRESLQQEHNNIHPNRHFLKTQQFHSGHPKLILERELPVPLIASFALPLEADKLDELNTINENKNLATIEGSRAHKAGKQNYETDTREQHVHSQRSFPVTYQNKSFREKQDNKTVQNRHQYCSSKRVKSSQLKDIAKKINQMIVTKNSNASVFTLTPKNRNSPRKINRINIGDMLSREDHWEKLDDSLSKAEKIYDRNMIRKINQNFRKNLEQYDTKPFIQGNKIESSRKSNHKNINFYKQRLNKKMKLLKSLQKKDNSASITPEEERKIKKILDGIISRYKGSIKDPYREDFRRHKTNKCDLATKRNNTKVIHQRKNLRTAVVGNRKYKIKRYPKNNQDGSMDSVEPYRKYPPYISARHIIRPKLDDKIKLKGKRVRNELNGNVLKAKLERNWLNKKIVEQRLNRDLNGNVSRPALLLRTINSNNSANLGSLLPTRPISSNVESGRSNMVMINDMSIDNMTPDFKSDVESDQVRFPKKFNEGLNQLMINALLDKQRALPLQEILSLYPDNIRKNITRIINQGGGAENFANTVDVDDIPDNTYQVSQIEDIMRHLKKDNGNSNENFNKYKDTIALSREHKDIFKNRTRENEEELKGKIKALNWLINYKNSQNGNGRHYKQENFELPRQEEIGLSLVSKNVNVKDREEATENMRKFMKKYKALMKIYEDQHTKLEQAQKIQKNRDEIQNKIVKEKDMVKEDIKNPSLQSNNKKKNHKLYQCQSKLRKYPENVEEDALDPDEQIVKQIQEDDDDSLENSNDIEIETYDELATERTKENEISINNGTQIVGNGTMAVKDDTHIDQISPMLITKLKNWEKMATGNYHSQIPRLKATKENEVSGRVNTFLNKVYKNPLMFPSIGEPSQKFKPSWDNWALDKNISNSKFHNAMTEESLHNQSQAVESNLHQIDKDLPVHLGENNVLMLPIKFNTSEFVKLLDYKDNSTDYNQEEEEANVANKSKWWESSNKNSYVFDIDRGPNGIKNRYYITFDSSSPNTVKVKNISTIPMANFTDFVNMANYGLNEMTVHKLFKSSWDKSNCSQNINAKNVKGKLKPEIRSIEKVCLWLRKPLGYNLTHQVPKVAISLGEVWPPMCENVVARNMKHYLVQVDPLITPSKFPNQHVDYPSQISKVVWKALLHGFKTPKKTWQLTNQLG